jgi:predicted metal-dependent hydrolase
MRTILAESRVFGGKKAPFKLREVKGARRIILRVTHEGVVVTKPYWVSRRQVEAFLDEQHVWIRNEVEKWGQKLKETLCDRVLYHGREHTIRRASGGPVRLADGVFWAPGDSPEERLAHVMEWMQRRARAAIRSAASEWAPVLGVRPKRVAIRDQVSRWGSCSSEASLSFNWRLVMAPPRVLEYIVIHELAHIRHHDHSRRFWSFVAKFCPDYAKHEQWLDDHNDRIMLTGRATGLVRRN